MAQQFIHALMENLADIVTLVVVVGVMAGIALFWIRRQRHVAAIRERLGGQVSLPSQVRETLAKAFNTDVAEVSAIGAVTLVDLAWQYSMADPSIWDHFSGPAARHISDAIQNLDMLKATLGDYTLPAIDHVIEYLRHLEAVQVFGDLIDKLPLIGSSSGVVLEAKSTSLVDALAQSTAPVNAAAEAKASAATGATLGVHIPLVTLGFATYRAWRRSQKGTNLGRNVEFAAIEVTTRAGGGLLGGKVGGVIGTAIVPGVGTLIGTVAGAVAGAIGGALLGEAFKKRHVQKASRDLNERLETLGGTYLDDPLNFQRVTGVFRQQEAQYVQSLRETRRRLRRYAMPWRVAWPDEKLVLLQETVRLAERRLGSIQQGTVEAMDRLAFMRETGQRRELGILLWSNPALCSEIPCDPALVGAVREANDRLRRELKSLGAALPEAIGA